MKQGERRVDEDGAAVSLTFSPEFAVPRATSPRGVPTDAPEDHPHLFFNRELSWLDFNWRVVAQAMDERNPLFERVRFLAIASSNLDEFFRKRVGGLKRQAAAGVRKLSPDGRQPYEQLALIREAVVPMHAALNRTWVQTLKPLLRERAGLVVHDFDELSADDQEYLRRHFMASVFPILTPLAVDPSHPFPFISNLSLSLAVTLRHPRQMTEHFARIKVPTGARRWVPLPREGHFVPLEQVIAAFADELFRGMEVVGVHAFRISRNADIRRNEEEADDLLEMISEELRERRFAPVVRLEVERTMPESVVRLLVRELSLSDDAVYGDADMIDFSDLKFFAGMGDPNHRYPDWDPVVPPEVLHEGEATDAANIFSVIRNQDVLVHHPYESFKASTQRFIEEASQDPDVLAIKQTLYRTSEESPIVEALIRAAERGKHVAVLVEVKARFDEQSNMEWGQMLEKSGVHVTYGVVGLKTHCKTTLVMRSEEQGPRPYCHIGTGNYNPTTAHLYTDVGLLTCDEEIGADVVNLFHFLTGYAPQQQYRRLLIAPRDMRGAFVRLLRREARHCRNGRSGRVIAKMNALDDVGMIQELYRASQAGVHIDLIVRGHCRLRPQLSGFSDNIRVRSIIGRFLEHSRIYYFENAGTPDVFIGSADWQRRNLDDRVEAIAPVTDAEVIGRLSEILTVALEDRRSAWQLQPDGTYIQLQPRSEAEAASGLQDVMMRRSRTRYRQRARL